MPGHYYTNPLDFLISTLFSLYIIAVMLRFLLGVVRADFYNPISQFLVRITNPLLVPLRRIIPGIGKFDTAALVLLLILQLLSLAAITLLHGGNILSFALLAAAVIELIVLMINVFIFAIFVQVILSWINPGTYHPANSLLHSLTSPVLGPIQRLIPPVSGLDLSPLFALIGLQVLKMLLVPLLG
jgi:YggT family protein